MTIDNLHKDAPWAKERRRLIRKYGPPRSSSSSEFNASIEGAMDLRDDGDQERPQLHWQPLLFDDNKAKQE